MAPNRRELGGLVLRKPTSKAEVRVDIVAATVICDRREASSATREFATSGLNPAAERVVLTDGDSTCRSRSGSDPSRFDSTRSAGGSGFLLVCSRASSRRLVGRRRPQLQAVLQFGTHRAPTLMSGDGFWNSA
ncbi:hypothetical protein OROGR_012974 [Orobanche gracilis]